MSLAMLLREFSEEKGLDYDRVVEEAARIGAPPLEVLVRVEKVTDYAEVAEYISRRSGIPLRKSGIVAERSYWYVRFSDGAVGIFDPEMADDARRVFPGAEIYIVPYYFFAGGGEEKEGYVGRFIRIVKAALAMGATDIHFEVRDYGVELRYRILGDMVKAETLSLAEGRVLQQVVKNMAQKDTPNLNVEEWRLTQDARIVLSDLGLDLRLAFTPSLVDGYQNLVIRILYRETSRVKGPESIEALGFMPEDVEVLLRAIGRREGFVIVSGATGSGKSRTLNTLLALVPSTRKVLTVEDPVEYQVENAVQHQVFEFRKENEFVRVDFLDYVREFMRQDPDVIFVGEWRKHPELTEAMLYAVETGHLVLTTLHASRVVTVPNLLIRQYRLAPEDLANGIILVLNQRLLKRVCPNCAVERKVTAEDLVFVDHLRFMDRERLRDLEGRALAFPNREGCAECRIVHPETGRVMSAGFAGRTVIYEYLEFQKEERELVLETTSALKFEEHLLRRAACARSFVDVALKKLEAGEIDLGSAFAVLL
ncbi:GspE/PulE family protein [Thermosulfurimonas sp. F29]|uniref:GspE/PulE family protein n=1 Tax=Thermosulfurimonas sp. F29 TaxID=2867247 RepID=UPI001C837D69|nr:ATPase, T2SS/T4P/T4SS family [Thermosulfurimonas sp. F29]MBX6424199.1 Flp pilus assembly complex ATPase component TadA [Thermosulfurimonas sp. F29]